LNSQLISLLLAYLQNKFIKFRANCPCRTRPNPNDLQKTDNMINFAPITFKPQIPIPSNIVAIHHIWWTTPLSDDQHHPDNRIGVHSGLRAQEKNNYTILLVLVPVYGVPSAGTDSKYAPANAPCRRAQIRRNLVQLFFSCTLIPDDLVLR
jgi:hypothetical protein